MEPMLNEKGEEAGPPNAWTEDLWQFWSLPVKLVLGSVIAYAALLYVAGTAIHSISSVAAESVAGVFATLLGLTFTAFSFLSAFMPVLRRDFVKSRTFLVMGQTFVVTMIAQISTFALAWISFLFHEDGWSANLGFLIVPLALISIALMAALIADLYWMFTAARNQLPGRVVHPARRGSTHHFGWTKSSMGLGAGGILPLRSARCSFSNCPRPAKVASLSASSPSVFARSSSDENRTKLDRMRS